jgi:hypothetical protein
MAELLLLFLVSLSLLLLLLSVAVSVVVACCCCVSVVISADEFGEGFKSNVGPSLLGMNGLSWMQLIGL